MGGRSNCWTARRPGPLRAIRAVHCERVYWVPERFPGVTVPGLRGPVLLWDGDCGFCARMLARLTRLARHPLADAPYQSVRDRLPPEILRWSEHQMHFVDARGNITGGSLALIEALRAAGRPGLAASLRLFRPLTWAGYRIAARARGHFSGGARSCRLPPP